ncbi:unnamed protein product [Vicia faba]|uniref:Uncharacterized protein n=1 Tax=Vicia faba TaxID=3906 RepID=A0AAV1BCI0_VICFA|nr:unnamed protein product [Vicia faba]
MLTPLIKKGTHFFGITNPYFQVIFSHIFLTLQLQKTTSCLATPLLDRHHQHRGPLLMEHVRHHPLYVIFQPCATHLLPLTNFASPLQITVRTL